MLVRLIYASTATDGVDMNEFKRILETAQKNNANRDLTGVLCFNSRVFLQALEGSREAVNDLYAKLMRDTRHHNLAIIKYEKIEQREYSEWSMAFAAASGNNRALYLKYGMQSQFNPYGMTDTQAEMLLKEMAASASKLQTTEVATEGANDPVAKKGGLLSRFIR
jgi:hypothetical protein